MSTKVLLIESTTAQYTAEEFSWLQKLFLGAGIFGDSAGVLGLAVSQRGAGANMSVDVAIGNALLDFTKSAVNWKIIGMSNAITNVPIASNASGSTRIDAIIMRGDVDVEPNSLKNNIITIERIAGTPGAGALSDANIISAIGSDAFIRLANITVANGAATIVTANIADTRVQIKTNEAMLLAPKVLSFTIMASDPTSPVEGQMWYNSTTHELKYKNNSAVQTLSGLTADNVSQASTDQTQGTQNATEVVGEANATLKKNKLFQSFIPGKTKIRGVKLYKSADTGTFTGTVTVSLQADSSGSPSGSDLASVVLTNAQWLAFAAGEFSAIFSSEYSSLVVGNLYWIAIACSTADNSNHPNVGTNSAGGYASGSVKYWNTTDGYVADGTIDLYFKTLEGVVNQIIKTGSSGGVPADFLFKREVFDSTGVYTMPTGASRVVVELIGGGGGGGGCFASGGQNGFGAGGGGGGYSKYEFLASQISSPVTITIPVASAGGVGHVSGTDGGNVTFGTYATGYGGGGGGAGTGNTGTGGGGGGGGGMQAGGTTGTADAATGGAGGGPAGGAQNVASYFGGGGGGSSTGAASIYGGGGGGGGTAGAGGASVFGGGGGGAGGSASSAAGGVSKFAGAGGAGGLGGSSYGGGNNDGSPGVAPGGGGGGAGGSTSNKNGGAGAKGRIIVTTYF